MAFGPVGWRVKDFADGWILFHSSGEAYAEAKDTGQFVQPMFVEGPSHLPPRVPCDCGRITVCRNRDSLPRCYACQTEDAIRDRSWHFGEPQVVWQIEALVAKAFSMSNSDLASISCRDIRLAFQADQRTKRDMATMRYNDWRTLNPIKTKEELANGPE